MTAKVIPFPIPLSDSDKARIRAQSEYEQRVALSSEVRELSPTEFERIQAEHREAVIRQAVLRKLDAGVLFS